MSIHRDIRQSLEQRAGDATISPDAWAKVQARIAADADPTATSPNPDRARLDTRAPGVPPVHGRPGPEATAAIGGDDLTPDELVGGARHPFPGADDLFTTRAAAVSRARRRRHLRTALASAAAVAVIATAGIVLTGQSDRSDRSEVTSSASGALLDPDLTFDWTRAGDLASIPSWSGGDAGIYIQGYVPGTTPEDSRGGENWRQRLYRLTDDGAWAPILDGDDAQMVDGNSPGNPMVSERDGTLYAVSADAGDPFKPQPVASISTDGGENWSQVPIEPVPPADYAAQYGLSLDIASTADRTLALVSAGGGILPQRWLYEADGATWTPIPLSVPPDAPYEQMTLEASADAFVFTATNFVQGGEGQSTWFRSRDGRTWDPLRLPPGSSSAPVAVGDSLLQVEHRVDRPTVLSTSSDGVTWSPLDPGALDPTLADLPDGWYFSRVSGPLGVALLVARPPVDGGRYSQLLLFSPDLERWSVTELDDVVPKGTQVRDVVVGADRIALIGHTDAPDGPRQYVTVTGVPRGR